jgi:F-type H+-transporting ATPase subunit gamma
VTRLAEIQTHAASMAELLEIVGALRSLAGMRVQEAQRALPAIRQYAESAAGAVGAATLITPGLPRVSERARGGSALILFTAEHGFVAGFNEQVMHAAADALDSATLLFVLGSRGVTAALERGWALTWSRPMPTRPAGAPEAARHLSAELYTRIGRGEISQLEVMFGRGRSGSALEIQRQLILPLDLEALATVLPLQAPLHYLKPHDLLEGLAAEYVFALLTEAAVESIGSENAARFTAMQSAHDNVSKKLDQLRRDVHQARQDEITTELLDLVTGADALTGSHL